MDNPVPRSTQQTCSCVCQSLPVLCRSSEVGGTDCKGCCFCKLLDGQSYSGGSLQKRSVYRWLAPLMTFVCKKSAPHPRCLALTLGMLSRFNSDYLSAPPSYTTCRDITRSVREVLSNIEAVVRHALAAAGDNCHCCMTINNG